MNKTRRLMLASLGVAWSLAAGLAQAADGLLTDLAGRTVRLPASSERILLGEGRLIPALAILEGEDVSRRIVGMPGDFEQLDPAGYAQYVRRFPRLREVAHTGRTTAESFSVEKAIALKPDVALFGLEGHGPSPNDRETLARLSAAGIVVVFIDFRKEPLQNTVRSMEILGRVLHRDKEAAAFVAEYTAQLALVTRRLATLKAPGPTVFLENRVGLGEECCATMSNGLMGRLLDAAGGTNMAKGLVPGAFGMLSLEHLISRPPDVYIGTAIGSSETVARMPMRIVLGAGIDAQTAQDSLARAVQRKGIATLPAVRQGRAHAIWHHFYNSPFNVVAVQVFAKWLHPELFRDLEPRQTLAMFYQRFQPVPLDGQYWTTLAPTATAQR
ncbi:iron-siderophore ABC transporter substrate-binding protein YiuA [soil metagenome]